MEGRDGAEGRVSGVGVSERCASAEPAGGAVRCILRDNVWLEGEVVVVGGVLAGFGGAFADSRKTDGDLPGASGTCFPTTL